MIKEIFQVTLVPNTRTFVVVNNMRTGFLFIREVLKRYYANDINQRRIVFAARDKITFNNGSQVTLILRENAKEDLRGVLHNGALVLQSPRYCR